MHSCRLLLPPQPPPPLQPPPALSLLPLLVSAFRQRRRVLRPYCHSLFFQPLYLLFADGGDRPVYAMKWAATVGVVPLAAYPYTALTGDCQSAFSSRKVSFAGAQTVDLSKPDNILQVTSPA